MLFRSGVASNDITQGTQSLMQNIQAIHPGFGALNAYCLMLFCLLYVPCAATIGTIKKESNSLKFTTGIVIFQILFAWIISVIVFQVGSLFL